MEACEKHVWSLMSFERHTLLTFAASDSWNLSGSYNLDLATFCWPS